MAKKDSNFKTSFPQIPKRMTFSRLKREGILAFDQDNVYPQRTELIIKGSATGKSVHKLYRQHISGEGFRDENLGSLVVNEKGQTWNEILKKIAKDKAYHNGFALHFNMDVSGTIQEITHVPFKYVRLPDDEHPMPMGRFAVYEDWEQRKWKSYQQKKVAWIFPFDPDPVAIAEQIEKSGPDPKKPGTIDDWKGQLYYWTSEDGGYPESPFDCSALDLETDQEIALFRNSTVLTSFLATYVAKFKNKFETEQESEEMDEELLKVQGGRHAGKVVKIEGTGEDDNAVTFEKLETIDHDGLFDQTEKSTQDNIRRSVLAPRELTGEEFASGFDSNRINDQRRFFNSITRDEREDTSEEVEKIMDHFHTPHTGDKSIIPLYEDELEEVTQEDDTATKTKTDDGTTD